MNLKQATKKTALVIQDKQDPDQVTYIKQWDESGHLKGWIVKLKFGSKQVTLDMTPHYCRIVGDIWSVPDYVKGKHQKI